MEIQNKPSTWQSAKRFLPHITYFLILGVFSAIGIGMLIAGENVVGSSLLAVGALWAFVYAWKGTYAYRYLFPSLMAFSLFVVLPLGYTVYIAFTKYSAMNFQTLHGVQKYISQITDIDANKQYKFVLYPEQNNTEYRLFLEKNEDGTKVRYLSDSFALPVTDDDVMVGSSVLSEGSQGPSETALKMKELVKLRKKLKQVVVTLPDEKQVSMITFSAFAPKVVVWQFDPENQTFVSRKDGTVISPNFTTGFYEDPNGTAVGPGFRVGIGFKNFTKIFTNPSIRGPFISVFFWTLAFSVLSVIFTFIVGFTLAALLQWKAIRGVKVWRALLILPYAVPAFISILIFKGLFNPQFGEINEFLNMVFGIRPEWTTDITLARAMIVIVNTWLGYPYMMILCTGILQSVPEDIYEASAIDGGNALTDTFKLTLPLILPPLKPLLIASFAFNFNNFLLINLLTNGGPQIVGAMTQVGYTDILVTYTFNIAFRDSANDFGFASAIATIIFVIVSVLSYINLKAATKNDQRNY